MSAGLPAGVVTFVFTDIEGSTRMLRDLGDAYAPLLDRHRELLGEAWQAYDGHIVKTEGDACFVAFGDAESAVRACADGQRRLAAVPWHGNVVPRVRMGVHTGVAYPRGDDYVAYAVHQAARVVSAAHGGQVLCTAETIAEVEVGPDLSPVLLGRYRLRDFDRPVPLYQITGDGLAQSFPAVRAIPSEGHNLVVPRSAFVGRASEFEALDRMVRAGHVVSIVGPGGVGKTRLVTEWVYGPLRNGATVFGSSISHPSPTAR